MATPISDHAHPKIIEITFNFLNLHQHAKNQFSPSIHSWDTVNFRVLWPDWPHPFLTMPTQNSFRSTFNLWICINMQKSSLFHWFILEIWLFKKSWNLIGWEHFGPYLRNNFPKDRICAGTQTFQILGATRIFL